MDRSSIVTENSSNSRSISWSVTMLDSLALAPNAVIDCEANRGRERLETDASFGCKSELRIAGVTVSKAE